MGDMKPESRMLLDKLLEAPGAGSHESAIAREEGLATSSVGVLYVSLEGAAVCR